MTGLIFYRQFTAYDPNYLARLNSIWRFHIRGIEKNRFPRKCHCVVCGEHFLCQGIDEYLNRQNVCYGCDLHNKVKVSAGTLFQLISAIPEAERDRLEIYPADFGTALIPLPLQSNWGWRTFEEWRREGVVLCGIGARSATGQDTLGLPDYSEGTRLLNKFGKYEFAYRQMGGPVWPGRDSHVALWLFGQLKTPEQQWTLKRIGRLHEPPTRDFLKWDGEMFHEQKSPAYYKRQKQSLSKLRADTEKQNPVPLNGTGCTTERHITVFQGAEQLPEKLYQGAAHINEPACTTERHISRLTTQGAVSVVPDAAKSVWPTLALAGLPVSDYWAWAWLSSLDCQSLA